MPTAVLLETSKPQGALNILNHLRSLNNSSPERRELLNAGVSMRRIDALYPFEFDEVAPVLTRLIQLHGLKHLKAPLRANRLLDVPTVHAALYSPRLFGIDEERREEMRQIFNNRAAEGTPAQQNLFATLQRGLRSDRWRANVPTIMHSLWVSYWLLANRSRIGEGAFSKFIPGNFEQITMLLLPRLNEALAQYEAELANPPAASFRDRLRARLGRL